MKSFAHSLPTDRILRVLESSKVDSEFERGIRFLSKTFSTASFLIGFICLLTNFTSAQTTELQSNLNINGILEASTNHAQSRLRFTRSSTEIDTRLEVRNTEEAHLSFEEPWEIEGDLFYRKNFEKNWSILSGMTVFDHVPYVVIGFSKVILFGVEVQTFITHTANFRFNVNKRFQWTNQLFTEADFVWRPEQAKFIARDFEFEISLMVAPNWAWAAGLMATNRSIGVGGQFQF